MQGEIWANAKGSNPFIKSYILDRDLNTNTPWPVLAGCQLLGETESVSFHPRSLKRLGTCLLERFPLALPVCWAAWCVPWAAHRECPRAGGERGTGEGEEEKALRVLLLVQNPALRDAKHSTRLCYKDQRFLWVPEEGMISYSWLFDEHTNCTGKNSAFDFVNAEVILRFSLFLGFTYRVSLNNDTNVLGVVYALSKALATTQINNENKIITRLYIFTWCPKSIAKECY